jgi:hypothetical protein
MSLIDDARVAQIIAEMNNAGVDPDGEWRYIAAEDILEYSADFTDMLAGGEAHIALADGTVLEWEEHAGWQVAGAVEGSERLPANTVSPNRIEAIKKLMGETTVENWREVVATLPEYSPELTEALVATLTVSHPEGPQYPLLEGDLLAVSEHVGPNFTPGYLFALVDGSIIARSERLSSPAPGWMFAGAVQGSLQDMTPGSRGFLARQARIITSVHQAKGRV